MSPAECKDQEDVKKLNTVGYAVNDNMITVIPNYVELKIGHTTIKIPQRTFRQLAEWYLQDQKLED